MSNGGKGSARRQEDVRKINENWDRIFGAKAPESSPAAAGTKKQEPIMELDDNDNFDDNCFEERDETEEEVCSWCGGCGEGDYDGAACRKCHGSGIEPRDDDYDEI